MSYFALLFKKISHNWLNLIPIILVCVFIMIVYRGNYMTSSSDVINPRHTAEQEIVNLEKDIAIFHEELQNNDTKSKAYESANYNLNIAEKRLNLLQEKVSAYDHKNWKRFYECEQKLVDISITSVQDNQTFYDADFLDVLKMDKQYAQYMAKHGLGIDERFVPTQGFSYMIKVLNNYMPMILTILVIFLASIMYCSSYVDNMNIHAFIPISKMKKQSIKLLVGIVCGFLIGLFFIVLSIGCGAIGNTLGSFETPLLTYTLEKADIFIPLIRVLPQIALLSVLSLFFIVNFVSVIAVFTKKRMLCLLISLAVIIGFMWMTTNIVPLSDYTHLLPTTYINVLKVISGEMMQATRNVHVSFINGIIVLGLSNMILFGIYYGKENEIMKKVIHHA